MNAGRLGTLALIAMLPLLSGCENSAVAYSIEGKEHALTLLREQPYFWSDEVTQYVIAARLPQCQRKVRIHPGRTQMVDLEVYEAGYQMWALHQGARWYLASTEECKVQDWDNPDGTAPGPLRGRFHLQDGVPVFSPAAQAPAAGG
ncbi:hypothetical protein J5J83_11200 [Azoarcus sp. L1K30]|uniref:hypothetical protein n=1 Tax=Azoarcus sp. L1K30 TaxID=2820277 RepID=UPI001B843C6D|nr:hypothetical protein [Azoarcus sp. L1K30]MBR0566680.1 hypothetical protein [Azoarcus sp. L1K30]